MSIRHHVTAARRSTLVNRGVTVKLEDGGKVHTDILVGADGIWSQVGNLHNVNGSSAWIVYHLTNMEWRYGVSPIFI